MASHFANPADETQTHLCPPARRDLDSSRGDFVTSDQQELVLSSWKRIEPLTPQAVDLYFKTLFAVDPGLRLNFPGDLDREGKRLFSVISTAVRMLDQVDDLVPVLVDLARQYEQRSLRADDYGTIGIALVNTLRHQLGAHFDAATQEAWIETWSLLSGIAVEAYEPVA